MKTLTLYLLITAKIEMYMNINKYINTQVYTVFLTGITDKECYTKCDEKYTTWYNIKQIYR